jgi:hypothetical protein
MVLGKAKGMPLESTCMWFDQCCLRSICHLGIDDRGGISLCLDIWQMGSGSTLFVLANSGIDRQHSCCMQRPLSGGMFQDHIGCTRSDMQACIAHCRNFCSLERLAASCIYLQDSRCILRLDREISRQYSKVSAPQ